MADSLGPIPIPQPPFINPFPLRVDWGSGLDVEPPIAIHSFDQPGLKTEQRFLLGNGMRRFRIRRDHLSCTDYNQLRAHWIEAQGTYAEFSFTYPSPTGNQTVRARYENPLIDFPQAAGMITGDPGITLVEVPQTFPPSYISQRTLTRFPDGPFNAALSQQVQRIIPLVAIQDRAGATTPLYLADQRITLDNQLYLPRLLSWDGISQSLGEASDSAQFTFGNADDVFTKLANQINLYRALIQFALFHVDSQTLVKLWSGYALPWSFDSEGRFQLPASDGVFELGLAYPMRVVTRTCWKVYKGRFCPSTSSLPDCPKSWEACQERGVPKSFGGVIVPAQAVKVKDNTTGVFGFGRSRMTSVTVTNDTIYQRAIQEIYTDEPMVVSCDVAAGRDESEFYSALGIVGEGPISGYAVDLTLHRLDGQPPHDPLGHFNFGTMNVVNGGGWRGIPGNDPAGVKDYFGISQDPWDQVPPGSTYAAGLAFAEIRRTDEVGLQLTKMVDRTMTVTVTGGIGGWTWTAPGARFWTPHLSNTIWVAVNVYLRAIGLRVDQDRAGAVSPSVMEAFFDVNQAIAMAAICEISVDKLVGTGQERQFPFRGVLKERKPLKDWLQEILNCCLGFYTFVNGKLWLGIRENSGVLPGNAFTRANILFKSLQTVPIQPQFNWLVAQFGDEEFDWQLNNVTVYDIDQASFVGTSESPQYNSSTMSLVGVSNKSQAARIISTRLREEIGGVGPTEQRNARSLRFRTTVLALQTMVGDIISLGSITDPHPALPTGRCEGRVIKWTLNPDFSIDIEASPSTDAMYDLDFGPKPEDAAATPVPPETLPSINGLTWMPNEVGPVAGDPLYPDILQRTFDVWQDYSVSRDGIWEAAIYVAGEMCINQMAPGKQPRILTPTLAAGGNLDGPMTIYLAITQRIANLQPIAPSNLIGLWIPPGATGRKVTFAVINSPDADQAWDLWAGNDRRAIGWQSSGENVQPTVDFLGPIHQMTKGLPETAARKVAIAAKHAWHSGVAGVSVTGVIPPNKIQANDFIGSLDNWLGPPARILSALADLSDGSAPLWNFTVTAFDPASGTFTVTPDCVRQGPTGIDLANSVQPGDVLIVRSIGVSSTASSVTDPMWINFVAQIQFDTIGLRPNEEKGRVVRILFGKGAGQYRYITGNDQTTISVSPDWNVQPDATSIIIVEDAEWTYSARTSNLGVPHDGSRVEIRMRVPNLLDQVALVGGFLVDDQDRLSDESVAPMREIFVFGQPPTVRVVGPEPVDPLTDSGWTVGTGDHTIRCDTSESDLIINLPLLAVLQGRSLLFVNDGGHDARINTTPPDKFPDGSDQLVLSAGNTVRITAGGVYTT